jgi:hypothetical protein
MKLWTRFRNLPTPLLVLHVTAKCVGSFAIGVLLGSHLKGYGWWILLAAFVIAIPSTVKILSGK